MNSEPLIKKVLCIDRCNIVHPKTDADVSKFPIVKAGKEYETTELVENYGKKYYRLKGFPDNHVFDIRGFKDHQIK